METNNSELDQWIATLEKKPEVKAFLNKVISEPEIIPILIEIIKINKGSVKFYCEKIIRMVSERKSSLVYPYFNDIAQLIESSNNFIKWGAIITLSNIVSEDVGSKFEDVYERYFSMFNSDSMITAGNAVRNAWKIVLIA